MMFRAETQPIEFEISFSSYQAAIIEARKLTEEDLKPYRVVEFENKFYVISLEQLNKL